MHAKLKIYGVINIIKCSLTYERFFLVADEEGLSQLECTIKSNGQRKNSSLSSLDSDGANNVVVWFGSKMSSIKKDLFGTNDHLAQVRHV
jgi:hypothetical protein